MCESVVVLFYVFQCLSLSQDAEDSKSTVNQHMVEEIFRL